MKTEQSTLSILQGAALQINGMFLFSLYSIRRKRRSPIPCILEEIVSYHVTPTHCHDKVQVSFFIMITALAD